MQPVAKSSAIPVPPPLVIPVAKPPAPKNAPVKKAQPEPKKEPVKEVEVKKEEKKEEEKDNGLGEEVFRCTKEVGALPFPTAEIIAIIAAVGSP